MDRDKMIDMLVDNFRLMNLCDYRTGNARTEEELAAGMAEQREYLAQKTDLELRNMVLINC